MIQEFDRWLRAFEEGKINRRDLLSRVALAAGAAVGIGASGTANAAVPKEDTPTFPSRGLNHIALDVTDVARSRDWYCKHLGLEVLSDGSRSCFLKTGDDFLALFQNDNPGFNHYCYTWPGKTADEAVRRLEKAGLKPRRVENRVYFPDPDGITVQVADENDWSEWD